MFRDIERDRVNKTHLANIKNVYWKILHNLRSK